MAAPASALASQPEAVEADGVCAWAALETAIRQRHAEGGILALILSCEQVLPPKLSELQAKLPLVEKSKEFAWTDNAKIAAICSKLSTLLEDNDLAASALFNEHDSLLKSALGDNSYSEMETALRRFDYEAGLQHLRAAAATRHSELTQPERNQ